MQSHRLRVGKNTTKMYLKHYISIMKGVFETSEALTVFDVVFPILVTVRDYIAQHGAVKPKELIERHGYPFEEHTVVTEDGYILTVHRIPHGKDGPSANRTPIFVQHGVWSSSADWVVTGPNSGAAFIFADAGFDVWLGNARGNTYSRKHKTLDPDSPINRKQYWDFTFHQMGIYDLPAVIDYILQNTTNSQLYYLGHSMGNNMFYVMASLRSEYNAKVKAFFSCAPAVYLQHMTTPVRAVLIALYELRDILDLLGIYEILSHELATVIGLDVWCAQNSLLTPFCTALIQSLGGFDFGNYNETAQGEVLQNFPAGASVYTLHHITQRTLFGVPFMPYDYGPVQNILRYNTTVPQPYPLSKVTLPVYIHTCTADTATTPTDAYYLATQLPNVVEVTTAEGCNHIDYMWGKNTTDMYLKHYISIMKGV